MIATPTWGTSTSIMDYHKESKDNYYKKEGDLGIWQGKLATELGLSGAINDKDLENLLNGKNQEGTQILKHISIDKATGERTRAGLDLTFNAPKSVSVAYELAKATGNEALASKLLEIHNNATTKVLEKIEKNYSQARETKDGITTHVDTGNLAIAKFQHDTARPITDEKGNVTVDPSLHTHAVIMNMTKSKDGTYKAIESKEIFENYRSAGMEYRSVMAAELKAAGFEIVVTDHNQGFYEIKLTQDEKLDEKILDNFSERSKQIEEALPALKEKYPDKSDSELKQLAAHQTREFKGVIDRDKVREDNLGRATELGLSVENINDLSKSMQQKQEELKNLTPEQIQAQKDEDKTKARDALKTSIQVMTDEKSVFEKEDIMQNAQKFLLADAINPQILDQVFKEQFISKEDDRLIKIRDNNYTTKEILNYEKSVLDMLKESKNQVQQIHTQSEAKEKICQYSEKQEHPLTKGQAQAAALILSSKDSIIGIQGDAGTGKTTMLKAVNALKEDTKLIGLSYTGKAASEIEAATREKEKEKASQTTFKEGGIKSSTIASFLNGIENGTINKQELKDAKLIVDEASMLGIKDANKLLSFAKEAGAQVVLMGDVKQFKAINAGDPFTMLQDNNMKTENMNEVLRQNDKTLKEAVKHLNNYNSDAAFKTLDDASKIKALSKEDNVIEEITKEYFKDNHKPMDTTAIAATKDTFKNNLILTNTNRIKDELNHSIRGEMRTRGHLKGNDITLNTRESSRLTPSQKYFASNYKDSSSIFLQGDIYIKGEDGTVDKLGKGSEFKIIGSDIKSNTLSVEDKEGKSHTIDLKKNSNAIQAYSEEKRNFAQGEKIVFEKNDKKLGENNGNVAEILKIDEKGNITAKMEDKTITFNASEYNYFNHGYAVTSYKAQGQTSANVIAHMPAKAQNFNSFYTVVTRAQDNLTIFTDSKEDLRSMIHNEQIKDNALSLNDKYDQRKAKEEQMQKLSFEERQEARIEAYNNAPASKRQVDFAANIAKELGIQNPDIGKRVNTDSFIKEHIGEFEKLQTVKTPSDKQLDFAQKIADKLYQDIDTSKMNAKETKAYISENSAAFNNTVKNPTEHLLSIDFSQLSSVQQDNYFRDLTRAEMFAAYKKDIDTLELLDQKHEKEFPQTSLEEKQIKIDIYATALDIKSKDYLDVMVKEHTHLRFEENIQKFGLDTPLGMANELKSQGLNYKDEKYNTLADLITEKQFEHLMSKHDGTNDKELEERNTRMIEFTQGFKEQLHETREYEAKINMIETEIEAGNLYKATELLEENRELLEEHDLKSLESTLEYSVSEQFETVQEELEKEFEKQEEFLLQELEDTAELENDNSTDAIEPAKEIENTALENIENETAKEREDEYEYER